MKNLLKLLPVLFLLGCTTDEKHEVVPVSGSYRDTRVYLSYQTTDGQDLLNPGTEGHYAEQDLRLYYVRNGEKQEVYDSNLDMPRNMRLETGNDGHHLVVFTDEPPRESSGTTGEVTTGHAVALLKLNETTTDTIKTAWERRPGFFRVTSIWYNSELKWDVQLALMKPLIVVVKE